MVPGGGTCYKPRRPKELGLPLAGVAELVDALDLGSSDESRGGSSPSARTTRSLLHGESGALFTHLVLNHQRRRTNMQVTETLNEGLRREFRVVVPATDLDAKVNERLVELKDRVRLNGFRPGKVPVQHLKRVYGRAVMAEAIEAAVQEGNAKIVSDGGFKLAGQPKVTLPEAEDAVQDVVAGKADLSYSVTIEILPKIELADFKDLKLERLVTEVTDEEVDEGIKRIAEANRPYAARDDGAKAETGDRVTISFAGTIDGAPFEGGSAEDVPIVLGSKNFLPEFEDQLVGIAAGETRTITVTFPDDYPGEAVRGKTAQFEISAKSVEAPKEMAIDDEFAKTLGMESLAKLKDAVKDRINREHGTVTRRRLKRALLDQLDERHKFDLPPSMVDEEFTNVWKSITDDLQTQGRTFADEGTTEDDAKTEYRKIAERRVRLGLVLSEIGERNSIKVTDEEVNRALIERARQFPGQERMIWDLYQKNPQALASLRAPIFEEKVVDFLVELAQVTEKTISRDELYREDEGEGAAASS
jgi:trigger factor